MDELGPLWFARGNGKRYAIVTYYANIFLLESANSRSQYGPSGWYRGYIHDYILECYGTSS